jgi:hypothetical protein
MPKPRPRRTPPPCGKPCAPASESPSKQALPSARHSPVRLQKTQTNPTPPIATQSRRRLATRPFQHWKTQCPAPSPDIPTKPKMLPRRSLRASRRRLGRPATPPPQTGAFGHQRHPAPRTSQRNPKCPCTPFEEAGRAGQRPRQRPTLGARQTPPIPRTQPFRETTTARIPVPTPSTPIPHRPNISPPPAAARSMPGKGAFASVCLFHFKRSAKPLPAAPRHPRHQHRQKHHTGAPALFRRPPAAALFRQHHPRRAKSGTGAPHSKAPRASVWAGKSPASPRRLLFWCQKQKRRGDAVRRRTAKKSPRHEFVFRLGAGSGRCVARSKADTPHNAQSFARRWKPVDAPQSSTMRLPTSRRPASEGGN